MLDKVDHRVLKAGIAIVLVMLLFGGIATSLRQVGWNEGFMAGLLAENGANAKLVTPYLAQHGYAGYHGHYHASFSFFGMLFRLWFFLFLLAIFAKFFGFWRWGGRHHHGWGQHGWGQHGWGQHGWEHHGGPGQPPSSQGSAPSAPSSEPTEPKPSGPISYV